jgi:hypothetical protein
MLKCASWLLASDDSPDSNAVLSLARELYEGHEKAVAEIVGSDVVIANEVEEILNDYSNDDPFGSDNVPQKELSNVEKLYAIFGLPYPDETPHAHTMLATINGWRYAYNSDNENEIGNLETFKDLDNADPEFLVWCVGIAEFECRNEKS